MKDEKNNIKDENLIGKEFVDSMVNGRDSVHVIITRIALQQAYDTFGTHHEMKGIHKELKILNKTLLSIHMRGNK